MKNVKEELVKSTKQIFKIIKNSYYCVEGFISDLVYYNLWKQYIISLLLVSFTSYFFNCLIVSLIILHLVWKCILFFRGRSEEVLNRRERNYWWLLDGWEFEEKVAEVLKGNGYTRVKVTKKTGDDGIDITCKKDNENIIIQCKHFRTPVPPQPVRALYGVKSDFNADRVILLASNGVTKESWSFIKNKKDYTLWTLNDIVRMSKNIKD